MELTHLLDTDVAVVVIRSRSAKVDAAFARHEGRVAVSSITVTELTYGALRSSDRDRSLDEVERFLDVVPVLEMDERAARVAGAVRSELAAAGTPIGPYDTLIAGQARSLGLVVATGNTREFRRVNGLQVENWR